MGTTLIKAHKGARYRDAATEAACTVDAVFRNPATGFAGSRVHPFASVMWDDGGRGFIALHDLEDDEKFTPLPA